MNYLTLCFNNCKVLITEHAKTRAVQRARLYFRNIPKESLGYWLIKDFRNSKIDVKYINCPFYVNAKMSTKGRGCFDSDGKFLRYHCRICEDGTIVVCTVTLIN